MGWSAEASSRRQTGRRRGEKGVVPTPIYRAEAGAAAAMPASGWRPSVGVDVERRRVLLEADFAF